MRIINRFDISRRVQTRLLRAGVCAIGLIVSTLPITSLPANSKVNSDQNEIPSARVLFERFKQYRVEAYRQIRGEEGAEERVLQYFSKKVVSEWLGSILQARRSKHLDYVTKQNTHQILFGAPISVVYSYEILDASNKRVRLAIICKSYDAQKPHLEVITFIDESNEWVMDQFETDSSTRGSESETIQEVLPDIRGIKH